MNTMTLQFASKMLQRHGIDSGPKRIFKQCREVGLLEGGKPRPAAFIHEWMTLRVSHWERNGMAGDYARVMITWSGLLELEKRLRLRTTGAPGSAAGHCGNKEAALERRAPRVRELDLGNGDGRLGF